VNSLHRQFSCTALVMLLAGCAGTPVMLGSRVNGAVPVGTERTISSKACGFQLMLFIPIMVNDRAERAYMQLEAAAGGDFITDVRVQETWAYGFVGTVYCTRLEAKSIRPKSI
jgi:hypothetical protein